MFIDLLFQQLLFGDIGGIDNKSKDSSLPDDWADPGVEVVGCSE